MLEDKLAAGQPNGGVGTGGKKIEDYIMVSTVSKFSEADSDSPQQQRATQ